MKVMKYLEAYSAQGWAVFPCSSADKKPLTPHGFKDASSDISVIEAWYVKHPGCAWGYATSADVGVADCDPRHGGDVTWAALIAEHGPIPETVTASTGGGGTHSFLKFPAGTGCSQSLIGPGIDVRADGGYVIVPPSLIYIPEHGKGYTWTVSPWAGEIAVAPDWLVALLGAKPGKGTPKGTPRPTATVAADSDPWIVRADYDLRTHPGATVGSRRQVLCKCLKWHTDHGVGTDDDLYSWAGAWAERTAALTGEPCVGWETHVAGCLRRDGREHRYVVPVPILGGGIPTPPPNPVTPTDPAPDELGGYRANPETPPPQPDSGSGQGGGGTVLSSNAYHGILGAVVQAVGPHTEADEPAVLIAVLAAFGSAVGFDAHYHHGKPHGANLFVGMVGDTASRKGTATAIAKTVIAEADPAWGDKVQHEGFGSGEGLIWAIRDASEHEPVGIPDKRLLVVEEEWEKMFTLGASDKSILTPIIRGAYDRIPLGKRNKGDNAYGVKFPHISIVANITPTDLRKALTGKNAGVIANGFLNRFLLVKTVRSKYLPRGGQWKAKVMPFVPEIAEALAVAKTRTLMALDHEAEAVWDAEYEALETRPEGVAGDATARAADMVMKLALVYALADRADAITVPHLRAAQAVWRYCEATAVSLFGGKVVAVEVVPDPLWLELLNRISSEPGVKASELAYQHKHKASAEAVREALGSLERRGVAYPVVVQNPNGGPRAECWYPGSGDGSGGEPESTVPPSPTPDPVSAEADAERPVVLPPESTKSPFPSPDSATGTVRGQPSNPVTGGSLNDVGQLEGETLQPCNPITYDCNTDDGKLDGYRVTPGQPPAPIPAGTNVEATGALKCEASVNGIIVPISPTDPDFVMTDEAFMRLLDHNMPNAR